MPMYESNGLSPETYADIVAYLLRENGVPAGPSELPADVEVLRNYTLEPGFEPLFDGQGLSEFGFLRGRGCTPKPAGCGQTTPGQTFTVQKGVVVCTGKPEGYMYTQRKFLNFTLRFDYRFTRLEGMESDDDHYGDSGYFLFVTDHKVEPRNLQIQGMNSTVLAVYPRDSKAVSKVDGEARKRALKPVGEWNAIEIVSKNGQVQASLNGVLVSTVSQHEFKERGHIGFQSEDAEISWRKIRIKEE
jgi:hypothetical protein